MAASWNSPDDDKLEDLIGDLFSQIRADPEWLAANPPTGPSIHEMAEAQQSAAVMLEQRKEPDAAASSHDHMAMNNRAPIATHMRVLLPPDSAAAQGLALEIGSGTGAQLDVLAPAFPGLSWRPSEYCLGQSVVRGFHEQGPDGPEAGHPKPKMRTFGELDDVLSGKHANCLPAVELDGAGRFDTWPSAVTQSGKGSFALVFASNVVHISPWAVAEGIFAGAGQLLRPGGSLIFHGPYKLDGKFAGVGHEQLWDTQMREFEGEGWGIREVSDMVAEATKHGLRHVATEHPVGPACNFLLHFVKEI